MSNIERLIEQYCSKGVVFCCVKDIAEVGTGISDRKDATPNGQYPFYVRSKDILKSDRYLFDETAIIIPGEGNVGEIFHFVEGKYDLHQRAYRIHFLDKKIEPKYAYYYFCNSFKQFITKKSVEATVTSIRKPMIEEFMIPVPPLEVQREIVRVLDNFTLLTAELTAELQLRKKQFEYYRDNLLLQANNTSDITILDMLSQPITDGPHETPTLVPNGIPFLSAEAIVDSRLDFNHVRGYITKEYDELCSKKYKPQKDDVYMCKSGSTTGKVAINEDNRDFNIWSPLAAMRVNDHHSAKFLYYLLQSPTVQNQVKIEASHGSQPNLSMRKLEQIKVHVPSLEIQKRIVCLIDNFDTICSDFNIGLPAEIEARKKQYEYYRDKLLSFKKLEN